MSYKKTTIHTSTLYAIRQILETRYGDMSWLLRTQNGMKATEDINLPDDETFQEMEKIADLIASVDYAIEYASVEIH